MIAEYVTVTNISTFPQPVKDFEIPGGRIVIQPGESYQLRRGAYYRVAGGCSSWMRRTQSTPPVPVMEVVPELEQVDIPLAKRPMDDVKAIAAGLGITYKVGMFKADLIAAISEAQAADIQEVTTIEDK